MSNKTRKEELEQLVEMLPKEAFTDGKRLSIELCDLIAHKIYSHPEEERISSRLDEELVILGIAKYMRLHPTNSFARQYADFLEEHVFSGEYELVSKLSTPGLEDTKLTKSFIDKISYKNNTSSEVVKEHDQLIHDIKEASISEVGLTGFKKKYCKERINEIYSNTKDDFKRYKSELEKAMESFPKSGEFTSFKHGEIRGEIKCRFTDLTDGEKYRAKHSLAHHVGTAHAKVRLKYGGIIQGLSKGINEIKKYRRLALNIARYNDPSEVRALIDKYTRA